MRHLRAWSAARRQSHAPPVAADAAAERFTRITTSAPIGIFETDEAGRCHYVNARWCELTGLAEAQAMGAGWMSAIDTNDLTAVRAEWQSAAIEQRDFIAQQEGGSDVAGRGGGQDHRGGHAKGTRDV